MNFDIDKTDLMNEIWVNSLIKVSQCSPDKVTIQDVQVVRRSVRLFENLSISDPSTKYESLNDLNIGLKNSSRKDLKKLESNAYHYTVNIIIDLTEAMLATNNSEKFKERNDERRINAQAVIMIASWLLSNRYIFMNMRLVIFLRSRLCF